MFIELQVWLLFFFVRSVQVLLVVVAIVVGAEEPTNAEKLVQEVINGENVTATVDGDRQNLETAELVGSALLGGLVGAGLGAAFGGSGYETSYYQGDVVAFCRFLHLWPNPCPVTISFFF